MNTEINKTIYPSTIDSFLFVPLKVIKNKSMFL